MAYPTATELRTLVPDLADPGRFPDATLTGLVEEFAGKAERYRGVAYITRTVTGEVHTDLARRRVVVLGHPKVQEVTALTSNDVDLEGTQVLNGEAGILEYSDGFGWGVISVDYTHGFATTPAAVRRACALFVRREALTDANPDSGNNYITSNSELGIVERAPTANWDEGRPTGWPDVDRILNGLDDYRSGGIA